MRKVVRVKGGRKAETVPPATVAEIDPGAGDIAARVALIQALIPVGLEEVERALQAEVERLAGPFYSRGEDKKDRVRWASSPGSIYLGDQKIPIQVPRVRDLKRGREVPLESYQALRERPEGDEALYRRILLGLSCRDYRACSEAVPEALGLSRSSVSRRFVKASERKLREFTERRLEDHDFVAMFLDGKRFAEDTMVVAMGVTVEGDKIFLGFVQTGSENEVSCREFLEELLERGLRIEEGLLVVIDGSKGLRRAITKAFRRKAVVARCQWHKRENVVSYLPKGEQAEFRRKLQRAYEKKTYEQARRELRKLLAELRLRNQSAANSLEEGLEETLTLHRLGVLAELGKSLKTTNCIESILSQVEARTRKVSRWRSSDHKRRWLAAALLETEPRLRRIMGCLHLGKLRDALRRAVVQEKAA
jgi:transposase-like protein